jgi:hypothetical protein
MAVLLQIPLRQTAIKRCGGVVNLNIVGEPVLQKEIGATVAHTVQTGNCYPDLMIY